MAKPAISGKFWFPSFWVFLQIHHLWNSSTSHAVSIWSPHSSCQFYRQGAEWQKKMRGAEGLSHRWNLCWTKEFTCFPPTTLTLFQPRNSHRKEITKLGKAATCFCGSRLRRLQTARPFWCGCAGSTSSSLKKKRKKKKSIKLLWGSQKGFLFFSWSSCYFCGNPAVLFPEGSVSVTQVFGMFGDTLYYFPFLPCRRVQLSFDRKAQEALEFVWNKRKRLRKAVVSNNASI